MRYKREPLVYSVGVHKDVVVHGTVECTATDGGWSGEIPDLIIKDRQDGKIYISDRAAVEALHAALGEILAEIHSNSLDVRLSTWERV